MTVSTSHTGLAGDAHVRRWGLCGPSWCQQITSSSPHCIPPHPTASHH